MTTFLIERALESISMPYLHGRVAASLRQVARMRDEGDLALPWQHVPAGGGALPVPLSGEGRDGAGRPERGRAV